MYLTIKIGHNLGFNYLLSYSYDVFHKLGQSGGTRAPGLLTKILAVKGRSRDGAAVVQGALEWELGWWLPFKRPFRDSMHRSVH
jgi:hypothetical protein